MAEQELVATVTATDGTTREAPARATLDALGEVESVTFPGLTLSAGESVSVTFTTDLNR